MLRRFARGLAWPLLIALLLACSSAPPVITPTPSVAPTLEPTASPSPTASPTPTPSPTPSPSPSPTPVDVVGVFVSDMVKASAMEASMQGSLTVGTVTIAITGETRVNSSGDTYTKTTYTAAGQVQTVETIKVASSQAGGAQQYTARDLGPFVAQTPSPSTQPQLLGFLRTLASLTDAGVVTHLGQQLHHLVPPADFVLDPAILGLTDPSLVNVKATVDFYAKADGTPVSMAASASWDYQTALVRQPASMSLELVFTSLGQPVSVQTPAEVWQPFVSKINKVTIGHPADWTIKPATKPLQGDELSDPVNALALGVDSFTPATSLAKDTDQLVSFLKSHGIRLDSSENTTVDGQPARLLKMTVKSNGNRLYTATVFKGGRLWVFSLATGPDPAGDGLGWLQAFLTTVHLG